jgi:mono/diheme cytochrome c family protein
MYHARTMSTELKALLILAASLGVSGLSQAADVQAGRVTAQSKCAQCHEADDWEGEDAASLESLIRDIVAGKVKHKNKLELSAAEIANIAAYWGQGKK